MQHTEVKSQARLSKMRSILVAFLALCVAACGAFVAPVVPAARASSRAAVVTMGNNAPDGPFTPVVLAGKVQPASRSPTSLSHALSRPTHAPQVVLGEKDFNKIRGKAISIHSQFITEFCMDFGVTTPMRGGLIKKAKTVGGRLGFLS